MMDVERYLMENYSEKTGPELAKALSLDIREVYEIASRLGLRKYKTALPERNIFIVYKMPNCPKCDVLKERLTQLGIVYEERWFSSSIQTEFVLMNEFGDPPILYRMGKYVTSRMLFKGYELVEEELLKFVGETFQPRAFSSGYDTHVYCTKCGMWVWKQTAGERCDVCGSLYSTSPTKRRRNHSPKQDIADENPNKEE